MTNILRFPIRRLPSTPQAWFEEIFGSSVPVRTVRLHTMLRFSLGAVATQIEAEALREALERQTLVHLMIDSRPEDYSKVRVLKKTADLMNAIRQFMQTAGDQEVDLPVWLLAEFQARSGVAPEAVPELGASK